LKSDWKKTVNTGSFNACAGHADRNVALSDDSYCLVVYDGLAVAVMSVVTSSAGAVVTRYRQLLSVRLGYSYQSCHSSLCGRPEYAVNSP